MKLLKQEPEVYNEIDRLYAEADFRWNLSVPLTALTIILSLEISKWFLLATFYVPYILVLDGIRFLREANLRWCNSLYLGYTSVPSIDAAVRELQEQRPEASLIWLERHLLEQGLDREYHSLSAGRKRLDDHYDVDGNAAAPP